MTLAIIVDGEAEFYALPALLDKIEGDIGQPILRPYRANIQPYAPPGVIAKACKDRVQQALGRGADRIVVLLDRELRDDCPGDIASAVSSALCNIVPCQLFVVIKDRTFENWVIADVGALEAQPARFRDCHIVRNAVVPNRADAASAKQLLDRVVRGRAYDKIADARRTLERADPQKMAEHSRSFRRLLRILGDPTYSAQSANPAVPPDFRRTVTRQTPARRSRPPGRRRGP